VRFLRDRRLILLLRLALGAVFLVAAWPKLQDPAGFARSISHYHMVPEGVERLLALTLPPLELLVGLGLIFGVLDAGAAVLVFAMLVGFTGAIASAVSRGLDISCGCFDTDGGTKVGVSKLVENSLMILGAWLVVIGDRTLLSVSGWLRRSGDIE
jgi:uncharacterized membrane protein YphA (DoxX/SURF4 family)